MRSSTDVATLWLQTVVDGRLSSLFDVIYSRWGAELFVECVMEGTFRQVNIYTRPLNLGNILCPRGWEGK
jgi:hypothetical protein